MSYEKEKLIQEIMFGDAFQESSTINVLKKSKRKIHDELDENCKMFQRLCQDKLELDFDGNEIVHMYEFIEKVDKIFCSSPLVNIQKFMNDFASGIHTNELLTKYLIPNYNKMYPILKILGLKKKRIKSTNKNSVLEKNLKDSKILNVYEFINKYSKIFEGELRLLYTIGYTRLNIIGYFITSQNDVTIQEDALFKNAITACKDTTFETEKEYQEILIKLKKFNISPINELIEKNIIKKEKSSIDTSVILSINKELLNFKELIINIIKNSNGVAVYSYIVDQLFNRNLLCYYAPLSILWKTELNELEKRGQIKRRSAFWVWSTYQDQYTLNEIYTQKINIIEKEIMTAPARTKFFGRKIDPYEFVLELQRLEEGDFDDQDDQVTRIAGLILADSPMLRVPHENQYLFNFRVDVSNFHPRDEQKEAMKKSNFQIIAKILHIKVMINEQPNRFLIEQIKKQLPKGDQAVIITTLNELHPDFEDIKLLFPNDGSIQFIDRNGLTNWARITPIIPSRLNSICKVRYGDNFGKIVQITSINFESGMATFKIIGDNTENSENESSDYIGALEEIIQDVFVPEEHKQFMENYKEFLEKLFEITPENNLNINKQKNFHDIIFSSKILKVETIDTNSERVLTKYGKVKKLEFLYKQKYTFEDGNHIIFNEINKPIFVFECTCDFSKNNSKIFCIHQVDVLNKKCLDDFLYDESWNEGNVLTEFFEATKAKFF